MSDSISDAVGVVLRKLSDLINHKLSNLLLLFTTNKTAGSLGAVAGFAIAVLFTWKFLRSPHRPTRPKPRPAPPGATAGGSQGIATVVEDAGLGHVVRRKLSGSRKVTCQLLGVVLEEKTPQELQQRATVKPSVLEVLLEISKCCDIYFMETVLDDESEEKVLSSLEHAGVFKTGGLIKEKVLFCSSETGRVSFVRQLEADLHIDTNLEVVSQLSRFISNELYISSMESGQIAPNVFTCTSLNEFFS